MKVALLQALAASCLLASTATAQQYGGNARFQTVVYRPQQIVQLDAAVGYQLGIEFAPDEKIESVALGDSSAWQVVTSERGNHLFLKPSQSGVVTNMTVITDTRSYYFDLVSYPGLLPTTAYTVRFTYPKPVAGPGTADAASASNAERRYHLRGDKALWPQGISDDGVKTFIEWPADASLPAVYAVEGNRERLVNGMMRDGVFVIDAVATRLVFRIDRRKARADRLPEGKKP
ncbi:TrbG/VirB9 family P-type conjugative transfer protein [Sphingomonas sp. CJ99]